MRLAAVFLPLVLLVAPQETDAVLLPRRERLAARRRLPADATDKERWLRRLHDEAPRDSANVFLSTRDRRRVARASRAARRRRAARASASASATRSGSGASARARSTRRSPRRGVRRGSCDANPSDADELAAGSRCFRLAVGALPRRARGGTASRATTPTAASFRCRARAVHVENAGRRGGARRARAPARDPGHATASSTPPGC